MELTPELKAQLAEQKKDCIFCKIISKEQEAKIVFEDGVTLAALDIFPAIKGHTVFFLKEHYPIMPYIPADEFKHLFGLVPQLSNAIKKAQLSLGSNVFIANGGAAGQRASHFMVHIFPRENEDNFYNLMFKNKIATPERSTSMLSNNLPIMMKNHFGRNPASWHVGKSDVPSYLSDVYEKNSVAYEDEKVLCIVPSLGVSEGHMEIYSKEEENDITKLSEESSAHLFFVASFAATAVFEGLGAHATNIILKSGFSDDNPKGKLCVHIIPRKGDDHLQGLMWEPKQPNYDLDDIKKKIKDKTWNIAYKSGQKKDKKESKPTVVSAPVMRIGAKRSNEDDNQNNQNNHHDQNSSSNNNKIQEPQDEIQKAIERLQK